MKIREITRMNKENIKDDNRITFKELLSTVFWAFKVGWKMAPVLTIMEFITAVIAVIIPIGFTYISSQILGEVVNIITAKGTEPTNKIIFLVFMLVLIGVVSQVNSLMQNYSYIRLRYRYDLVLWTMYLEKTANLDFQYHEDPEHKTLEKKAQDALYWRFREMMWILNNLLGNIISLVLIAGIFLVVNPLLLLFILIPVLISFLIDKKFGNDLYGIWNFKGDEKKHAENAQWGLYNNDVLREAKIYNFASYLIKKYTDAHTSFNNSVVSKLNLKYFFQVLVGIIDNFIFAGIQFWLILQAIAGKVTIANYSFYLSSLYNVSQNLNRIESNFSNILEYAQYVRDLKKILELKDVVVKPENGIKLSEKLPPKIEFKNVSFKYPTADKYVLKDLSFVINPGEKISLVGENGAGKTTLIKLMARFYDVTEGEILINDKNIKELDLQSYYKLWGVLFQKYAQYWFTVRENIGIGNVEDIDNKDLIEKAGTKAGIDSVLEKLPNGYENMLSTDFKDGKDLSGGEWQKVGIARGLFANPKFIVLDEPTSALDALAEAKVFEEIESIAKDTTMLIVSHRFATVRNADKILVLENGQISEQGSHDELMAKNGLYFKMFTTQAEGYK